MKNKEQIKLSKYDQLWLNELYGMIKENKRPSYRFLRAKLYKKLPAEYNPDNIDNRFARYKGEEITLEGVAYIDPERDIINKANKVINGIKNLLINDPEKQEVDVEEIAKETKLNKIDISLILRLISPYARFWSHAGGNQDFQYGYGSLNFQRDNAIFDEYIYFNDIRDLIERYNSDSAKERISFERSFSKGEGISNNEVFLTDNEVKINPIFRSRIDRVDNRLCFVLMPFKAKWSDEIFNLIKSTIESLGFQCLRADNLSGPIIMEDIWTKINQAGFIIADVTNKNPNVMYEVGIAHTIGRPTILLTQNTAEIPFDFAHLRHIEYKNSVSGSDELRKKLKDAIDGIYKIESEVISIKKPKIPSSAMLRKLVKGRQR